MFLKYSLTLSATAFLLNVPMGHEHVRVHSELHAIRTFDNEIGSRVVMCGVTIIFLLCHGECGVMNDGGRDTMKTERGVLRRQGQFKTCVLSRVLTPNLVDRPLGHAIRHACAPC